ncbi:hypothetical protein [Sphingomonas sp.]|uniref:hypothetical protein n=1 Tax=Sphingomonas sp. TaxID=28214 RepID=UPI0025E8F55C|nr:hypothetical protein [Sphingomonas sp.]
MKRISPIKAALSVGIVIGLYHLMWVMLVATGAAQSVLNFILRLHFIELDIRMAPYDAVTGATLVGITFAIGAMFGLVFALVWNWLAGNAGAAQPAQRAAHSEA